MKYKEKVLEKEHYYSAFNQALGIEREYYVELIKDIVGDEDMQEINYSEMDYQEYIDAISKHAKSEVELLKLDSEFVRKLNAARYHHQQSISRRFPEGKTKGGVMSAKEILARQGLSDYFDKWEERFVQRIVKEKIRKDIDAGVITDSVPADYFLGNLIQAFLRIDISEEKLVELKEKFGYQGKRLTSKMMTSVGPEFILANDEHLAMFLVDELYKLKKKTHFTQTSNPNEIIRMGKVLLSSYLGNAIRPDSKNLKLLLRGLLKIVGGETTLENFMISEDEEFGIKQNHSFVVPNKTILSLLGNIQTFMKEELDIDENPVASIEDKNEKVNYGFDIDNLLERYVSVRGLIYDSNNRTKFVELLNKKQAMFELSAINGKNIEDYIAAGSYLIRDIQYGTLKEFVDRLNEIIKMEDDNILPEIKEGLQAQIERIMNIATDVKNTGTYHGVVKANLETLKGLLRKMGHYKEVGILNDLLKMR